MSVQKATRHVIDTLSASKLTGALPALDGSLLTNVGDIVINSAVDPAIDSNKSLGTLWVNTTSGEVYSCTDATTDANVWTNVGAGSGDVVPFGAAIAAYQAGGENVGGSPVVNTSIAKFTFASESSAASPATLGTASYSATGHSSTTHGYQAGGFTGSARINNIFKYAFAGDNTLTDMSDLTQARNAPMEADSSTHGYIAGGYVSGVVNTIDKFAFANTNNATDVGDLTAGDTSGCGHQSSTHGYKVSNGTANNMEKYSFATGTQNATAVQSLSDPNKTGEKGGAVSTATHGYYVSSTAAPFNIIRYSFASETDVADTSRTMVNVRDHACASLRQNGDAYWFGSAQSGYENSVEKFNVNNSNNATDVTNLDQNRREPSGSQY